MSKVTQRVGGSRARLGYPTRWTTESEGARCVNKLCLDFLPFAQFPNSAVVGDMLCRRLLLPAANLGERGRAKGRVSVAGRGG